jgi:hypothetical protein
MDEDGSSRSGSMTGETLLNWGTCRTELNIMMVGSIFVVLGLGLLLYMQMAFRGGALRGEGAEVAVAVIPAMTLFLYLGMAMVVITLFVGGAPSISGASGFSLGTRVSFLAFLLAIEALIYLGQTGAINENGANGFIYLFAGLLALVIIFWSLYQKSVASYVGKPGAAGMAIPFMLVGLACIGINTYQTIEAAGLGGGLRGVQPTESLALIATGSTILLAVFQAALAGAIKSGITTYVLRNMPR